MRVIEGTVDEIVEYQQRTGQLLANGRDVQTESIPTEDPPASVSTAVLDSDDEEAFFIKQFVYNRANNGGTARRVIKYLEQVIALGTLVEVGESERTHDGLTDYVMVRDQGPRRFGAVAYVRPANGGLTLRLRPEDVDDIDDERMRERNVSANQQYAIICPLADEAAVDLALSLTKRALEKVRPTL